MCILVFYDKSAENSSDSQMETSQVRKRKKAAIKISIKRDIENVSFSNICASSCILKLGRCQSLRLSRAVAQSKGTQHHLLYIQECIPV